MPFIRCTEPAFIQTFKDQLNWVRFKITCGYITCSETTNTTKVLKYERKDSGAITDEITFEQAQE